MRYETCPSECAAMNHPGEEHEARVIPDGAVEAAAKVIYELDYGPIGWEGFPSRPRKQFLNDAKKILEAAAPHMLAEAWEQGRDAEFQRSVMKRQTDPNPYRSQA